MSALAKAVVALDEINEQIERTFDARMEAIDSAPSTEELNSLIRSVHRLNIIRKPFTPQGPDIYKGLAVRRVEARLWSGIITNPGGFGIPVTGRKKSVYLDGDSNSSADSHGVHYADLDAQ